MKITYENEIPTLNITQIKTGQTFKIIDGHSVFLKVCSTEGSAVDLETGLMYSNIELEKESLYLVDGEFIVHSVGL